VQRKRCKECRLLGIHKMDCSLNPFRQVTFRLSPRKERGSQLVQTGWKSDGRMAGNGESK
jgi:hypothetical protein